MNKFLLILKHSKFCEAIEKIEVIESTREFCRHGIAHAKDVARIAYIVWLEKNEKVGAYPTSQIDKDIIYAIGLLHDIGRSGEGDHNENGERISREILSDCGYSEESITIISNAILQHGKEQSGIAGLLHIADRTSRDCSKCKAVDSCYWSDDDKKRERLW